MRPIKLLTIAILLAFSSTSNAQVIISILFGDKLNSDKIEFGLVGGDNLSFMNDLDGAKALNSFNLGFYFHINLKNKNYLSTGVLVKSNVGASGIPVYEIGDEYLDSVLAGGSLTKKINYFYVPVMYHRRMGDNRWYLEGGFQLGLRNKAKDIFEDKEAGGDVSFTLDAKDQYKYLDAGLIGGFAYKLKKEIKSTSIGVNYYYGLMNVSDVEGVTIKNSSIYLYGKIPIGAGKSETPKDP